MCGHLVTRSLSLKCRALWPRHRPSSHFPPSSVDWLPPIMDRSPRPLVVPFSPISLDHQMDQIDEKVAPIRPSSTPHYTFPQPSSSATPAFASPSRLHRAHSRRRALRLAHLVGPWLPIILYGITSLAFVVAIALYRPELFSCTHTRLFLFHSTPPNHT